MELTYYSGTSFYITKHEWGEKMIQSLYNNLPLPAVPYNVEDVNICGPAHQYCSNMGFPNSGQ